MDLRRKISYQWQLFVPLTLTLWVVIIGMGYLQFHNEAELRREKIREQLDLVNARVIAAYEKDFNPDDFLDFVARYYIENPLSRRPTDARSPSPTPKRPAIIPVWTPRHPTAIISTGSLITAPTAG